MSRILVVEDEPALALAVSEALTDAGFIVDRAGDGQEALRRVNAASYDLIVCDLKMPKVDGMRFYQTLGSIQGANSQLAILLNSALRRVLGEASFIQVVRDVWSPVR